MYDVGGDLQPQAAGPRPSAAQGWPLDLLHCDNRWVRPVRFTQSARKHRIGKAHALAAMEAAGEPERVGGTGEVDDRLCGSAPTTGAWWAEVIGIDLPDYLLIIHVMPLAYRRD